MGGRSQPPAPWTLHHASGPTFLKVSLHSGVETFNTYGHSGYILNVLCCRGVGTFIKAV